MKNKDRNKKLNYNTKRSKTFMLCIVTLILFFVIIIIKILM